MIKFYRRIRQNLIANNKFSKYSLYALGEITLVVAGILIALQINNWNEQTRLNRMESSTLFEIKESLDSDIHLLQNQIELQRSYWKKTKRLVELLQTNHPYNATIDSLLPFPLRSYRINLNISAFELLENRGIDLISNTNLRKAIVNHFKYDQAAINKSSETWKEIRNQDLTFFFHYYDPILDSEIIESDELQNNRFKILDYQKFRADPLVLSKLKHRVTRKIREIKLVQQLIQKKAILRAKIEHELSEKAK